MHENIQKLIIHGPMDTWDETREVIANYLANREAMVPKNGCRSEMFKGATATFFVSQRSTGTITIHTAPPKEKTDAGNTATVENAELPGDGGGV